ncbi:unnamed protein product [Cylicocyclus nassatus]|uniref:Uncharacterized protein n=1 Tax=Cylicocyclus nassatus TaxID=53992 RepID=A0AA36GDT0_CYLNA|nr:unnamed protein product [Cylicocyclus nassatus]
MNGATDGPLCSLISYVVPPGLSRVPATAPTDSRTRGDFAVETISAKNLQDKRGTTVHLPERVPIPQQTLPRQPARDLSITRVITTSAQPDAAATNRSVHPSEQKSPPNSPLKPSHPPRKPCLTRNNTTNIVPARLNLRKKTVAFGKTVNLSQTVEATSRASKLRRQMNKSTATQMPLAEVEDKENKPINQSEPNGEQSSLMEILKEVKSSLEALKAHDVERAEEIRSIRRMVDDRGKEMDKLRGIVADFFGRDCPRSTDSQCYPMPEKKNEQEKSPSRKANDYKNSSSQSPSPQRYTPIRKEMGKTTRQPDRNDVDDVTFEEFRYFMTTNPAFRQYVADLRAEENEKRNSYRFRGRQDRGDSWKRAQEAEEARQEDPRGGRGTHGAKFTEKVTVERSIRCAPQDVGQYSVDTRRYIADQILEDEDERTCERERTSKKSIRMRTNSTIIAIIVDMMLWENVVDNEETVVRIVTNIIKVSGLLRALGSAL